MILVFGSVTGGKPFVEEVTLSAGKSWRRSIRAVGGFWQGSFTLEGDDLLNRFYTWLEYHVEERTAGVVSWEGLIYEMEFKRGGVTRRRSLDGLANAVKTAYIDAGTDTATETAFAVNEQSVGRYGRKELMISLDDVSEETAIAARNTALARQAWPVSQAVGVGEAGADELRVTVCGYVFTANWRFMTVNDGATGGVSAWLRDIVETDCDFLGVGRWVTNGTSVVRKVEIAQRAWDTMQAVAAVGDVAGTVWVLRVEANRLVVYEPLLADPVYHLRGGVLTNLHGRAVDPYLVRPAVVRDLDYPVQRVEYAGFLQDARDFWVEEVVVADGKLQLKVGDGE